MPLPSGLLQVCHHPACSCCHRSLPDSTDSDVIEAMIFDKNDTLGCSGYIPVARYGLPSAVQIHCPVGLFAVWRVA